MAEQTAYKTLKITKSSSNPAISYLFINRPSHHNALSPDFFTEFPDALYSLDHDSNTSVIILAGTGHHFCSGIDISSLKSISQDLQSSDPGRASERLRRSIKHLQAAITALEKCRKPVIASIHGACIGAAIDIVTACDIRYCSVDSFFSVKEVDLAIPADLGTLQRLPSLVGFGNAMELALTGRNFPGAEAKQLGLVSGVFESREKLEGGVRLIAEDIIDPDEKRLRVCYQCCYDNHMLAAYFGFFGGGFSEYCILLFLLAEDDAKVIDIYITMDTITIFVNFGDNSGQIAHCGYSFIRESSWISFNPILMMAGIAAKSPLAVTGTKAVLLRSKELTVEQGLDYVATWNAGMLLSTDLKEAISAYAQKRKPVFSKL